MADAFPRQDSEGVSELLSEEPFRRLHDLLQSLQSVVVAYSGGVDSAFLLHVAQLALGGRARGVLAYSESLDRHEFDDAKELASRFGWRIDVVETNEYANPEYRKNDGLRCYHCKTELFEVVGRYAREQNLGVVCDGSHAGDRGDYRPGLRARDEQSVRSPLMEAELDKEAIRDYSRRLGLPTWDKPAAPCLSSRIPYGSEVERSKLRAVEAAEHSLRQLGFPVVRVRHHGDVARIEVPLDRVPELLRLGETAVEAVRAAGFRFVTVDLEGFRSGSLNRALEGSLGATGLQGGSTS
ncbi:MAG: ATP-dependent sacrificial sulfur transferase LarE [Planctomycetota bacterium]